MAIVYSTDAFGTSGMKNLVEDLKGMDVEPALVQGYTNNSQDFTPVVLAVKQSGADGQEFQPGRSGTNPIEYNRRPHRSTNRTAERQW